MSEPRSDRSTVGEIASKRVDRRRFAQGVAATAVALGVSDSAVAATSSQSNTKIKFWTHTHPPMVELNKSLIQEFMT
ncbi:MAG: hypothetical protein ACR2OU_05990, partial [Thermomicrobiales bacterium]